jgi:hypothetical protein
MSVSIKLGNSASSRPIKGYSHKGFVMGWCAIMIVAVMAFGLLTLPLGHTRANLDTVQAGLGLFPAS